MEDDARQLIWEPPAHRFDPSAWKTLFTQSRRSVDDAASERDQAEIALIQGDFRGVVQRLATTLAAPAFRESGTDAVKELGESALRLSRVLQTELASAAESNAPTPPLALLRELVAIVLHLLERLEQHVWLTETTDTHAELLNSIVSDLLTSKKTSTACLRNLTHRILIEQANLRSVLAMIPQPGVVSSHLVRSRRRQSESTAYAMGIQTARILIRGSGHWPDMPDELASVVMAALLQDVGFLILEDAWSRTPDALARTSTSGYAKHCETGAALAAGLEGLGVPLSQLVAQHHERCDGTGYPRGITRRRMTNGAMLLQIGARFVEHLDSINRSLRIADIESSQWLEASETRSAEDLQTVTATPSVQLNGELKRADAEEGTLRAVGDRLLREALQGELDLVTTRRFLRNVADGLLERLEADQTKRLPAAYRVDPLHDQTSLHRHAEETSSPPSDAGPSTVSPPRFSAQHTPHAIQLRHDRRRTTRHKR